MSAAPAPITFSLDVVQCARIRRDLSRAAGEGVMLSAVVISFFCGARYVRFDNWHDPFVWIQIVFWGAYAALIAWRFSSGWIRPETATTVAFDDAGLTIRRSGADSPARRVPFRRIRSVWLTPTAVAIYGVWKPLVVIPVDAVPDGATHVMRFFEERIVSRGMPPYSGRGGTKISNSLWPLFDARKTV